MVTIDRSNRPHEQANPTAAAARQDFDERDDVVAEIDRLAKELSNARRALKPIDQKIETYARHHDPDNKGWTWCGRVISFELVKKSIKWKDKLVEAIGLADVNAIEAEPRECSQKLRVEAA